MAFLKYLLHSADEVNSYGYELYDNNLVYCCRLVIPSCYDLFVTTCLYTPELISSDNVRETAKYFNNVDLVL